MSVQFKEELLEETKFAQGECSNPPLQYDVSDDFIFDMSDIYDSDIDEDDDSYHGSPIRPKLVEKPLKQLGI